MSVRILPRCSSVVVFVSLVVASGAFFAPESQAQAASELTEFVELPEFVEFPGVMEFSGMLSVRPVQPQDPTTDGGSVSTPGGLDPAEVQRLRSVASATLQAYEVIDHFDATDEYLVRVPTGQSENTLARALWATGAFDAIEPNWKVFPVQASSDPLYPGQWMHHPSRVHTAGAWALTAGRSDIVVAICDTGLRSTHEDLSEFRREGFHVPTRTWQLNGGPIDDPHGHGTACMGVAVAPGHNGVGIAGMGWGLG